MSESGRSEPTTQKPVAILYNSDKDFTMTRELSCDDSRIFEPLKNGNLFSQKTLP